MFPVSLVPLTQFSHKVLTSRIAVLPFAGVFKNVTPANGQGVYAQLVKKLPALYGTRRLIAVFTRARHNHMSFNVHNFSRKYKR
jgi:hypothetical protein